MKWSFYLKEILKILKMQSRCNPKALLHCCFYFFIGTIFQLVLINNCRAELSTNKQKGQIEATGPTYIINELFKRGVFNVPGYSPTNKYDKLKQDRNLKGLFFNGLPYHGKPTKVFCWYGLPETLNPGEKAPAVILVHGGGGTVFPEWVEKWTDQGYIAISVALEGQAPGPKTEESNIEMKHQVHEFSGPFRHGFFRDVMTEELHDQWFFHAVANVILANSLIHSFPEVDTTKIGITGISWGGILTNVITGIDHRFKFSIPVYGCGYLAETPLYAQQLKLLTPYAQQFYHKNWEPSLYIPLQEQAALFIDGTNDCHFPMNSFMKTFEASPNEKYLYVEQDMIHGHSPGWEPEEIYSFADYITGKGVKPPEFILSRLNYKRELKYRFSGKFEKAFLFYTADTSDWGCKSYRWNSIEAKVIKSDSTIASVLPEDALYYFVNGVTKDSLTFSSPMRKNNKPKNLTNKNHE